MPANPRLLVLWDIDLTLVDTRGAARRWYDEAFLKVARTPLITWPDTAGRTDLSIAGELFRVHGCGEPEPAFFDEVAHLARDDLPRLRKSGRVLPGVPEALGALAGRSDVVQSTVTGNLRALAEVKLTAFGLRHFLDPDIGAYGMESAVRSDLVAAAVRRAHTKHRSLPSGCRVVVVGDTPNDVHSALVHGAVAVAVATGQTDAEALRAAGAHHVLGDLSDTGAVLRTVLQK